MMCIRVVFHKDWWMFVSAKNDRVYGIYVETLYFMIILTLRMYAIFFVKYNPGNLYVCD